MKIPKLYFEEQKIYDSCNVQQKKAFEEIYAWSQEDAENGYILVGSAGCGKTFLLKLIASVLPNAVLCAPTNKAVKELKKLNLSIPCCTIYSLLGLKMEQFEDTVVLTKTENNRVDEFDFVVLDECGMTNKELFKYIKKAMRLGVKFLFVGDPEQLPPIGEDSSLVWDYFDYSKLTKVMRHDNAILEYATHVRKCKFVEHVKFYSNNDKKEGVWNLHRESFITKLKKYAKKGYFEEDSKAIAWRNITVDEMNDIVRFEMFGKKVYKSRFLIGDKLVFTKPYASESIQIFTDDEAIVLNVLITQHPEYDLKVYHLKILVDDVTTYVRAIHEESEKDFESILSDLAIRAKQPKSGFLWKEFWALRNYFCYVKYGYALTAHRSQGSTYKYVFVDARDILYNPKSSEAKKCLYVAVTRPAKRLFLT